MAKASYTLVQLVNEEHPDTGTKFIKRVPTRGTKSANKLRLRKYDPVLRKHCWFIQKKLTSGKSR